MWPRQHRLGVEAFYPADGEQCLETPTGAHRISKGNSLAVPAGVTMRRRHGINSAPRLRSRAPCKQCASGYGKWTLMSTTARWSEPTPCLNRGLGPFVRTGPQFFGASRSVELPLLVTDLDENTFAGWSKSAGRVRRGHGSPSYRRHRRLPQRSRLL